MTADEALAPLAARRGDAVVVTTMSSVRPWARHSDGDLDLASADSAMGHAADLALGVALARPDRRVVCVNGDGSMLMTLGTLATVAGAGAPNLFLVVLVNGTYEITGNQRVPGSGGVDFADLARAAGIGRARRFSVAEEWEAGIDEMLDGPGPVVVHLDVEPGDEGPIRRGDHEAARYLQVSLADSARIVRQALEG